MRTRTRALMLLAVACCCATVTARQATPTPGCAPIGQPRAAVKPLTSATGFTVDIQTPPGLHTIIIWTPKGNHIEIYIPNRIYAGTTFSASMKVVLKTSTDRSEIAGFFLTMVSQPIAIQDGPFKVSLPPTVPGSAADLKMLDKSGKAKAGVTLPVESAETASTAASAELWMPASGTSGDLLIVAGPFSGEFRTSDAIKVGGKAIQLLAKTSGFIVALNDSDTPGIRTIEVVISGLRGERPFRNLVLAIAADKMELKKGETTWVHIDAAGLERLEEPARMTVSAAGTVNMTNGNAQTITINATDVKGDGTYRLDRRLQAAQAGPFTVDVVLAVKPYCAGR